MSTLLDAMPFPEPGRDPRTHTQLTHIGQIMSGGYRTGIPLETRVREACGWIRSSLKLEIPDAIATVFGHLDSGAEARFLWEFSTWPGARLFDDYALTDGVYVVRVQVPQSGYRMDFVVSIDTTVLAIEVDGAGFHNTTPEQVAKDYVRERALVARFGPVMRFTAREAFHETAKCWCEIDAYFRARVPEKRWGSSKIDPVLQKRGA